MPLNWINIRSGERTIAETEPQIAALWSSSDHSPNITQGQDFGWRLAPEIVVEMKKIKQDLGALERIASRFGKSLEDIGEVDILTWISNKTKLEAAPEPDLEQFKDEYDQEIRKLEGKLDNENHNLFGDEEVVTTTTTKSLDDLRAELAAREASEGTTTTTSAPDEVTTTTTEAPTTTSTTTEAPSTTTTTTQNQVQ